MKNLLKTIIAGASTLALAGTMLFGLTGVANAAGCWQYNANGFPTSQTPVFNNICGVPGYGNESDFVRIRQSNGDDTSTSNNADYTNVLNNACTDGTEFDVHTYIHNDAEPEFNDNGSGSAVAHDVQIAMNAPLGKTQNQFVFTSTLTASNAPTASDTATLNCGGEAVTLSLVPNTVKIYGTSYGYKNLDDSAVNGTTKIGDPTFGSGDEWGCWNYRMAVVYEVAVHVTPKPTPSTGVCKEADIEVINKKNHTVSVSVTGETTNATIVGYRIDFGDNTVVNQQSATHQYAKANVKYHITAYVEVKFADNTTKWIVPTSTNCQGNVIFTSTPPVTPPPTTPPTTTPPTTLPSTGPAGLVTLFAGTSGLGAVSHWLYRRRKFNR